MTHPVKITHMIIDLAGKLDWQMQRGTSEQVQDAIKNLRNEINKLQKFLNEHEVEA